MSSANLLPALIVEDDAMQADIFQQAIENAGFQAEIIDNGPQALQRLEHFPAPVLVVLDLHLPGVSGEEILRHIRSAPHLKNAMVILATANPRIASPLEGKSDLVLIKPVSFTQLRDMAIRLRQRSANKGT